MKKSILYISLFVIPVMHLLNSCKSGTTSDYSSLPNDPAIIAEGKSAFSKHCSGCHGVKRDGIGPRLAGITAQVHEDWLRQFIKDPQQLISSGDKHAQELFAQYKVVMPSFPSLKDDELNAIIAFLHTNKASREKVSKDTTAGLKNPLPDPITMSSLTVNLKPVVQFPRTNDAGQLPLTRITKLGSQPNMDNLFINDLFGKLYKLQNNKPVVYLDMAKLRPKFIYQPGLATGLGSFAFHPDFFKNGLLYTTHTEAPGTTKPDFDYSDSIEATVQWVLTEWKVNDPKADTFSAKESRELFRANFVTGIHGVQEITFNPLSKPGDEDYGLLYIGVGDGGSVENDYAFLAHSKDKIWGSILRIDPTGSNSSNGKYGIPKGNPFVQDKESTALKEIYAYGFRNPHRITWTRSGKMLASNIGQANIESVNLIEPGHDYGWPLREGTFVSTELNGNMGKVHSLPADDSINKFTYPVAQFDHDEGLAITGGYEYWGTSVPQLKGKFLFGDIPSGRLFYIDVADIKQGKQATIKEWKITIDGAAHKLKEVCGSDRVDLHFGRDTKGELYVLTKADGRMYKMVSATNQ